MYHCAETFLCPYCDTVVLQSSLLLKNKVKKISIKGGVFLCGLQESLASGFHLKHKGVFLPDLYSFTQWVDLPLLFPSKESPDETFVRPIIGYVHVASSSTSLGAQPQALSWIDLFLPLFLFFVAVCAPRNHSDKCLSSTAPFFPSWLQCYFNNTKPCHILNCHVRIQNPQISSLKCFSP